MIVAALKKAILRTGLEALYFSGSHLWLRPFVGGLGAILTLHEVPFAIYIPTSFPDRLGELWWLVLEAVIAKNPRIGLVIGDQDRRFDCRTVEEKRDLFEAIYWWLRGLPSEDDLRCAVR